MITALRIARYVAVVIALAATAVLRPAEANHYILPCPPDCRDIRIGPGMTGSWFVPDQSGYGFTIQVLPGQPLQMLVSWFVFEPQGGHAWIVAQGPVQGTRAVLQGNRMTGSGGRFPPNFDAAAIRSEYWGTLTLAFADCKHGRVEWASTVQGYGYGFVNIERLTLPAGLTCEGAGAASDADDMPR